MNTNNAFICPEIKCGQVVEVDVEYVGNNLVCYGGCQASWCRNCLISPYHYGKSCIEIEAENKNTDNGKLIWDLKRQGKLKFCPQCRAPCIKNNGCNKMSCSVCKSKWCWICEAANIDYTHYNTGGVSDCKGRLWEGVDDNGDAIPEVGVGNPPVEHNPGGIPQRMFPVPQQRELLPAIPFP
jgi:hypothetical protein